MRDEILNRELTDSRAGMHRCAAMVRLSWSGLHRLAEELPCSFERAVGRELIVPRTGKAHEALGCGDQLVKLIAERDGHDRIFIAVQNEKRGRYRADEQIGAEAILDQQSYGKEPVDLNRDVGYFTSIFSIFATRFFQMPAGEVGIGGGKKHHAFPDTEKIAGKNRRTLSHEEICL